MKQNSDNHNNLNKPERNPKIRLNHILQTCDYGMLVEGEIKPFGQSGIESYPLNTPIFLVDSDLNVQAAVKIQKVLHEVEKGEELTGGYFKVIRVYDGLEKKTLSNVFKELYGDTKSPSA